MDEEVLSNIPAKPHVAGKEELSPYIDYVGSALLERWKELEPAFNKLIAMGQIPAGDEATAGMFAENIRMANKLIDAIEILHRKEKAPYWDGGKQWDAWKSSIVSQIDVRLASLRAILSDFASRKRATEGVFAGREVARGIYGSVATTKLLWSYEVTDMSKVPRKYLKLDEDAIKQVMRERYVGTDRPRRKIPGIEWVQKTQLAVS